MGSNPAHNPVEPIDAHVCRAPKSSPAMSDRNRGAYFQVQAPASLDLKAMLKAALRAPQHGAGVPLGW